MKNAPAIHLAIIQPAGYVHSLGFLDQARYFRHMLRRQGATVTLAKNRLREDAVNVVFGAHLGFPADWQERHACVFVNLEQLGQGGAAVNPDYLALLRRSAVVDYDAANVPAYAQDADDVPIVSFGYAAYLDEPTLALEQRPIDLLFFGSVNARRREFIARVESAGFNVACFDSPVYGEERDEFIRRSKAVLNCHYYDSNRFEQARAFHCLSLGTPLISEYTPTTDPAPAFRDSVLWLPDQVEEWFRLHFDTPAFFEEARRRLAAFRTPDVAHDPMPQFAELLDFASGFQQGFARLLPPGPWQPRAIHLGAGADYKPSWLNIDTRAGAEPDLSLDLSQPLALPCELPVRSGGTVRLEAGTVELVIADEHIGQATHRPTLMANLLALLKVGGACAIELPCANGTAAAPSLSEQSWADFTDGFWRHGGFDHRFEMAPTQWLDATRQPADRARATCMRLVLRKAITTPRERTLARTMQLDFGGLPDDRLEADSTFEAPAAHPLAQAAMAAAARIVSAPGGKSGPASLSALRSRLAAQPAPAAARVAPSVMTSTHVLPRAPIASAPSPAAAAAATPAPVRANPAGLPDSLLDLLLDA